MTTSSTENLVVSKIKGYGEEIVLACDGKCQKAWGVSNRPNIIFDEEDPDDMAFLADDELGDAPRDSGTYEGSHGKPASPVHNKWCFRECERSDFCEVQKLPSLVLPNFSKRRYNQPWKHEEGSNFPG
jgi:hypothetical protein